MVVRGRYVQQGCEAPYGQVPGYVVVLLHSAPDIFGDCTVVSALELNYRIALAVLTPHVVVEEIARFAKHVYYDVGLDVVYVFF